MRFTEEKLKQRINMHKKEIDKLYGVYLKELSQIQKEYPVSVASESLNQQEKNSMGGMVSKTHYVVI